MGLFDRQTWDIKIDQAEKVQELQEIEEVLEEEYQEYKEEIVVEAPKKAKKKKKAADAEAEPWTEQYWPPIPPLEPINFEALPTAEPQINWVDIGGAFVFGVTTGYFIAKILTGGKGANGCSRRFTEFDPVQVCSGN